MEHGKPRIRVQFEKAIWLLLLLWYFAMVFYGEYVSNLWYDEISWNCTTAWCELARGDRERRKIYIKHWQYAKKVGKTDGKSEKHAENQKINPLWTNLLKIQIRNYKRKYTKKWEEWGGNEGLE